VAVQVGLACIPVVGAGLLVRSFVRLLEVDPGFAAGSQLSLSFSAPRARYPDAEQLAALAAAVRTEVSAAPGVTAAGLAQTLPFAEGMSWWQAVSREHPRGVSDLAALPHVMFNVVSPGFAEALGVTLHAGRSFHDHDTAASEPVVVINEAMAQQFFPGENPLGRTVWVGHAQALPDMPARTVVGVIGNAHWQGLDEPAPPAAWVPLAQQTVGTDVWRSLFLIVQTAGDSGRLAGELRQRIARVDPDLALMDFATTADRVARSVWRQRVAANLVSALGVAALVIAVLGVFAIVSHLTRRRAHEFGVRVAVGARPRDIVRLAALESGSAVALGLAAGLLASFALARGLDSLLYGGDRLDGLLLSSTLGLLGTAALLACLWPARRAAKVDPVVALRAD
jgi:predicted permease